MATKRNILDRHRRPEVSPEAVRLWRVCVDIKEQNAADRWEDGRRPGRRREYLSAGKALCRAVGLDWAMGVWPTDTKSATVPAGLRNRPEVAAAYRQAWAARCALEAAAAEAAAE
jgi:hypothetical protein